LSRIKRKSLNPGRAIARLMLFNVSQFLLSVIAMFCYYLFVKVQEGAFLLSFSAFYIFFMGLKYFIIYNIDNQHKTEKKRLKDAEDSL
jgi:uncharacterized membrane protein